MATSGLSRPDAGLARCWGELHPASELELETDADLVEALRRGDVGAAGRVYDRYAANVHGLVYRLAGPQSDLEDIVQEVFIYAFDSLEKLREPAALKGWLLGIAAGKARAHLRRAWRRRWLRFLPNEELPDLPVDVSDPQAELLREALGLLDELPPDERLALVLRRVEGLAIHEAASASGMSISTFKRRLARGETRFLTRAKQRPGLAGWLTGGLP